MEFQLLSIVILYCNVFGLRQNLHAPTCLQGCQVSARGPVPYVCQKPDQMNKISHHLEISSQLCRQCSLVPRPQPTFHCLQYMEKQQKAEVRTREDGYGYSLNRICCWVHEEAPCHIPARRIFVMSHMHAGLVT